MAKCRCADGFEMSRAIGAGAGLPPVPTGPFTVIRDIQGLMLNVIRHWIGSRSHTPNWATPPGQRIYAVGDVHGRLDLLEALLALIEADESQREPAETTLIFLGDLVDRGPDSAGVLARARTLAEQRHTQFLMGNHEEMMLASLQDRDALRDFLKFGGRETVLSYGLSLEDYTNADLDDLQNIMRQIIPHEDIDFLKGFLDSLVLGEYLFVHAGIRPGISLIDQDARDLRWIRGPFLDHQGLHPKCVVHGHNITQDLDLQSNRIGVDTGAFKSGCLTALGLEGEARWKVQAVQDQNG